MYLKACLNLLEDGWRLCECVKQVYLIDVQCDAINVCFSNSYAYLSFFSSIQVLYVHTVFH